MQLLRARVLALFTALLSLLAVALPVRASHFCRRMDRVVDSCCCESSAAAGADGHAELKAPDCCVRLSRGALPAAESRRDLVPLPAPPALVPPQPRVLLAAPQRELPDLGRPAQRVLSQRGPPLFLQHCALLI